MLDTPPQRLSELFQGQLKETIPLLFIVLLTAL
jgi:hypothetical protein